ncbi:YncE family protein [Jiulongibacter sediminis]|jgi:DNA-binding beta-propeller fold protein YncE|uniref:YncE family protein n=1 Tax=Jiulongibacter sediminis TaxID=1605367 RepID=UPI0026EF5A56|nr:YncE family protein [Jiulongibacter sediminis]
MKPALFPLFISLLLTNLACQPRPEEGAVSEYQVLVVEQGKGQVKRFNQEGKLLDSVKVGYNPHEIEWDATLKQAYVSNFGVEDYDNTIGIPGSTLAVIDPKKISESRSWSTLRQDLPADSSKGPHGVKLRPGHDNQLYVNVEYGNAMLIMDPRDGQIQHSFAIPAGTHNFLFSNDGSLLYLMAGTNGLYTLASETGEELAHFPVTSALRGLALTKDESQILLSCVNELYLLNTETLEVVQHYTDLGVKQIIYTCFTPDEKWLLAPCPYDDQVLVIERASGRVLQKIKTGKAPICVKISPDQSKAFVANALDKHLSVIDLKDHSVQDFGVTDKPNGFLFLNQPSL